MINTIIKYLIYSYAQVGLQFLGALEQKVFRFS